MVKNTQLIFLLFFIITAVTTGLFAAEKTLILTGMKIFRENEITDRLSSSKRPLKNLPSQEIIRKIKKFYINRGYSIVKIYVIENSSNKLSLYIDEGYLNRILFLNVNTLKILELKYRYRLEENIFNVKRVKEIIREIKKKEDFPEVTYRLIPSEKYDKTYFQLDRKLNLPVIGETQLPFFNRYGSRFRLEFYLSRTGKNKEGKKKADIDYNLRSSYVNGLMPEIIFTRQGLLSPGDRFRTSTSAGIMYGLDRKFNNPPTMKFFQVKINYHFSPFSREFFTPHLYSKIYRSKSSRTDLGILTYDYWLIRSVFAPGITLLRRIEMFTGLGIEHDIQFDSVYDREKTSHADIEKGMQKIPFIEMGIVLSRTPFDYLEPVKQTFQMTYSYYYHNRVFHEFELEGKSEVRLPRKTIYQISLEYSRLWGDVPFYHEKAVSSGSFKGFMNRAYHSWHIGSLSNELRISIYKEFIYIGFYLDGTVFRGSGYDLTGKQIGIVTGPITRVIFLDQFEAYAGYGKDLLFSTGESQHNVSFGLKKKW